VITALDRISVGATDVLAAALLTERLLGKNGVGDEEGMTFELGNVAFDIAPAEADGLTGLAFEVADIEATFRACERRALKPMPPVAFAEAGANGIAREGRRITLDTQATFGVPVTLVGYTTHARSQANVATDAVSGLDHVVVRTTHPSRAAALYGARLGLDMRLDRTEPKWGSRLMFFRCGDLIVEVVHYLAEEPSDTPDKLWGLSWRVANADAANARLKREGFDVSEVRPGRKPGTKVFTVRNNTLGIPTLCVEPVRR
jgi:catechol 2,3-dioxygenase-like lactoylglutathione lyase family enzyme